MHMLNRRKILGSSLMLGGTVALLGSKPLWARSTASHRTIARKGSDILSGTYLKMIVRPYDFNVDGRVGHAICVNGTVPGPLVRLKEGQNLTVDVVNQTQEDTSIHWHGLLVPFQMDGVPGVTFPGIKPGAIFRYEFPIRQAGTYWWHAHSLQEAMGHYGPIIIEPAETETVQYDRDYIIMLSDWSPMHPHTIIKKLKQQGDYFNHQRNTFAGLLSGDSMPATERLMWAKMRMSPNDISDVTGATYSYLLNGHGPGENWTGLFKRGERVRLRFINGAAMTIFNIRIPGLPMTIIQADGQNVQAVTVDEFQLANAETYDVIVTPTEDRAFGLVAETIDRSGMAFGTLAPRIGMVADKPKIRAPVLLTMQDMGMDHTNGGEHADHNMSAKSGMKMDGMTMNMRDASLVPPQVKVGVGNASIAPRPFDGLASKPLGLRNTTDRILIYTDLISLTPNKDTRKPTRYKEIHLTANMERYMWSFDGKNYAAVHDKPIRFAYNERVRVKLVNDTMMTHPIHLHGHFFELVNGHEEYQPRKHTVTVQPGASVEFDLTANEPGDWAFHCHLLYHMHNGMFQVVTVRPLDRGADGGADGGAE